MGNLKSAEEGGDNQQSVYTLESLASKRELTAPFVYGNISLHLGGA